MTAKIPDFSTARILVVGDVMLDRYWQGETSRISPEAPVPVVHVKGLEERPGGAGNVALNVAALGGQVTLLGLVGDDVEADRLEGILNAAGVRCCFDRMAEVNTITKLRVLSQHQQLIRLDFENGFKDARSDHLLEIYRDLLKNHDVVVLSDYGKGTLGDSKKLVDQARKAKIPVLVDPKKIDFSVYAGATLITPNFKEFQMVAGPCETEEEIVEKGQALIKQYKLNALLITRGEQGMTLIRPNESALHISTHAQEVYDVTGAGDTVIAVLAACVASKIKLSGAVKLANVAAGIVITKLGAATVSAPELAQAVCEKPKAGILNEEQLLLAVQRAKEKGKKIVMTNGCFDILHAGHIHYLKQAKALGALLIVAVNDDLSVAKLKGENRPVNQLMERMVVLTGLSSVDWVVPFSEDTPARLIGRILPDVLVKGGDYLGTHIEEIAGATAVLENGGEVKIVDFVEGCSTSEVINRIYREGE